MVRKSNDILRLQNALETAQAETTKYRLQNKSLLEELETYRIENQTLKNDREKDIKEAVEAAVAKVKEELLDAKMKNFSLEKDNSELKSKVCDLESEVNRLNSMISSMMKAADNAAIRIQTQQAKLFTSKSERQDILNNRDYKCDRRGIEKENFDGSPESVQSEGNSNAEKPATHPKRKKKSLGRKPSKENYDCAEVVFHPLSETFTLPEGARFKTRNGEVELHKHITYEYVPGRFIKHIYETATYETADGDCKNTLPEELRENPIKGCPFSIPMLVFILVEKYAYHNCKNTIRRKLKEMGVGFSKSTFVRYYQLAESVLRDMYEGVFRLAVLEAIYLMIDETCELVAVQDKQTLISEYFKKYLWGFYNKEKGLVQYLYENGSRATAVLLAYLEGYTGAFTSDGYVAYKYFDGDKCPEIEHYTCNVHARRAYVDSLPFAYEESMSFIDDYAEIFHNETKWKDLDPDTRQKNRERYTLPIFKRMHLRADAYSKDDRLMAIPAFKKAINYFLNHAETLRGFIFNGNVECGNNLVEQRFKTIKLDLKNCQVIGSERAAENAAFMHSLVESCRLNNLNPAEYLTMLFSTVKQSLAPEEKRELLPDKWRPEC